MSSLVNCMSHLFRRRPKTQKLRHQQEASRRRSITPIAQTTESETGLVDVPEPAEIEIPVRLEGTTRKHGRPEFATHISAEPDAHSDNEDEAGQEVVSTMVGDESNIETTKEIQAHTPADVSAREEMKELPNRNEQTFSKSPFPKFSYEVRQPTLPEPLVVSTSTNLNIKQPPQSPSPTLVTPRPTRHSSDASNRSRSHSEASSTTEHWLKEKLEDARIECPRNPHSFLIPRDVQESLITVPNVTKDIIARNSEIKEADAKRYAEQACQNAPQLYATLAYVKKGAEICQLLDEGVTDGDLPLVRRSNERSKFALYRKNGEPIRTMQDWKDKYLENFDRVQWWMTAPVFKFGKRHKFDVNTILPFIPFPMNNETKEKKQGAYSKVYPVKIHHAHERFDMNIPAMEEQPLFAVKQLFSSEKSEFLKEATILEALRPKEHPHLIKLLATFEKEETYHLLFPYADANLRKYWDDHPLPKFNKETVLWCLKQMEGIASGLVLIHHFKVTEPGLALKVSGSGKGNIRIPGGVELSVAGGEEWYGRHGDIKPENILWFSRGLYPLGVLQIADFGLGRFHGRDSRSGVSKNVVSSPTYEPPECKLSHPVSRAYDIWSLGCLYLEFITWLLKGNAEIEGFANTRGRIPTGGIISDDYFYTIITSEHGIKDAVVREGVLTWVAQLHAHEKCSQLIHDLLDLIMRELLVVDSGNRSKAVWLRDQLKDQVDKAETDDDYLLKPNPIPILSSIADPKTLLGPGAGKQNRYSVTFSNQEKPSRPINKNHSTSQPIIGRSVKKDLVGRTKGTPGLNKMDHFKTWPEK